MFVVFFFFFYCTAFESEIKDIYNDKEKKFNKKVNRFISHSIKITTKPISDGNVMLLSTNFCVKIVTQIVNWVANYSNEVAIIMI